MKTSTCTPKLSTVVHLGKHIDEINNGTDRHESLYEYRGYYFRVHHGKYTITRLEAVDSPSRCIQGWY